MSRQYLSAGNIVGEVDAGKSFKAHCASMGSIGKVDYALAAETLKYKEVLEQIFEECKVSAVGMEVKNGVLLVMAYELLFGSGKIKGGGVVKRAIMEHLSNMKDCLAKMMIGKSETSELLSKTVQEAINLPKYIRVNEAKLSVYEGLEYVQTIYPEAVLDKYIPSLVVLPASSKSFGQNAYVQEGKLIIQDKASCFPSQILANHYLHSQKGATVTKNGKPSGQFIAGGDFVDACAAPGNKTSHLAAEVMARCGADSGVSRKNKQQAKNASVMPKIFAFDKSLPRSQLLSSRMQQAGVDGVVNVQHRDFLSLDVNDEEFSKVTSVLLDPSCSGSGVARAVERVHESESGTIDSRIDKLRNFQIMALRKALTFPQMQRVVYSTCSVHDEENESVVAEVLNNRIVCEADASSSDAAKQAAKDSVITSLVSADWELVAPIGFEDWTRRGNASSDLTEQQSACLLRCLPEDGTNGFFVAMFQRKATSTTAYNLVTIATAPEKSTDGGNYNDNKKRKGELDGEHNQEGGFAKKNKQNNTPAFDRNAIVARNQQKKTVHIPPTDGTVSLITTGSLFGKKRFAVSKSAKRTFGKKK